MKNIFDLGESQGIVARINQLSEDTQRQWGKMSPAQMMAHCCVGFEMANGGKHPRPNAVLRFIIRLLAKKTVTGDQPYKKNSSSAPEFIIEGERVFEKEKARLIEHIEATQKTGEAHFLEKGHPVFGKLSSREWQNFFYKHLDHHLRQFGV